MKYSILLRTEGILVLCMLLFSCIAFAQPAYVSSITQITVRSEPGVAHRIIEMVKSATPLEIIDYQKDWSKVRTPSGNEGWILTRFITQEKPKILLVDELKEKNQALQQQLQAVVDENKTLTESNDRLADIELKYTELKKSSARFLTLKKEFNRIQEENQTQADQIERLESSLKNDKTIFMLCGLGVFVVGIIFGASTRKKKKSSLL